MLSGRMMVRFYKALEQIRAIGECCLCVKTPGEKPTV